MLGTTPRSHNQNFCIESLTVLELCPLPTSQENSNFISLTQSNQSTPRLQFMTLIHNAKKENLERGVRILALIYQRISIKQHSINPIILCRQQNNNFQYVLQMLTDLVSSVLRYLKRKLLYYLRPFSLGFYMILLDLLSVFKIPPINSKLVKRYIKNIENTGFLLFKRFFLWSPFVCCSETHL